jgi:hypothetical protein
MQPDYTQTIIADLVGAQWPMPLAERFARNFPTLDPIFTPVVQRWYEDHTVIDVTIYGCSLTQIMQARGEHFWVGVRNMNAIYTNTSLSETQRHALMQHLCVKPALE